jgi:hypothetical protein
VEVYGSSETAGLGWRSHYQEPFRLLPWWQLQQQPHEQGLSTTATCTRTGVTTVLQDKIECISDNLIRVHGRQDAVIQIAGTISIWTRWLRRWHNTRMCTPPKSAGINNKVIPGCIIFWRSIFWQLMHWEPEHYPVLSGIYRGHLPTTTTAG